MKDDVPNTVDEVHSHSWCKDGNCGACWKCSALERNTWQALALVAACWLGMRAQSGRLMPSPGPHVHVNAKIALSNAGLWSAP